MFLRETYFLGKQGTNAELRAHLRALRETALPLEKTNFLKGPFYLQLKKDCHM